MSALKNLIRATATAVALTATIAGAAHAEPGYLNGFQKAQKGDGYVQVIRYRRGWLATPVIDDRIANQSRRIRRGRASGRLTRIEAIRLRGRLFAIRSARKFARLDGQVSRPERRRLRRMLNENSVRITRYLRHGRRR